jgi:hypothetical protein
MKEEEHEHRSDSSGPCKVGCLVICTSTCRGIYAMAAGTVLGAAAAYAYYTSDFGDEP